MSCSQSDSCSSSCSDSSSSKSCSDSCSSSYSNCNSGSSSSKSCSNSRSADCSSTNDCTSDSSSCGGCKNSNSSCSCDKSDTSYSSCGKCSSGSGSCVSSCDSSDSCSDSCASGSSDSCSDSCGNSCGDSCSDCDSCASKSGSCSSSSSCSSSGKIDQVVYDLATADVTFVPTAKALECADFVGSRVVARGYIYKGNTICNCKAKPFTGCGIICGDHNKPQYPCDVVGTYDLEYTIVNPEFNRALACLFSGYFCKYFELSKRLAGRVLANGQLTLSFSDSADFNLPSVDTLVLSGRIAWGLKGDEWSMAVLGGTGDYFKAYGEASLKRLCLTNGSRTRLGESWRLCLDPNTVIDRPVCKK